MFMPLGTLPQHDEVALEPRNSRIGSAVLGRRLVKLVPHASNVLLSLVDMLACWVESKHFVGVKVGWAHDQNKA